ncbi:aminotransferase class III-fold pyridoxal phosphate-dependent enzyme [Ramlibacter sp. H39-3-26]|uniref:aspartate aminotransferase family protein n=1 Tax=Curvibacter soli TaxID=3031331 RepID=UPI0023D97CF9|nr:aminotransferase class III-fold pyridoxal phosphate-dependent enzyme [Ramlibacter sp. H39-3-26]MDF1485823.1 aminotransferase class III-fold pyridoxal phosphate-dependent enzyme [Ramlibacter sp. H39-3-26]
MRAAPTAARDIAGALADATARFAARHPRSATRLREAQRAMPGGNTRSVLFYPPFPVVMARGDGCRLWDVDGHGYLDALGEFTAGLYGHSNPIIRGAIEAALRHGLSLSAHNEHEPLLALEVQRRFPSMELLRFTNSGTEANLLALAAAWVHTGRRRIMVFDGAYHGGVLSFTAAAMPLNVPHEFVRAPYNDLAAARALALGHADGLAAILVEPMQGSGGCIPGEPDFLHGLRALADDCGALLVFDEVMTSRLAFGGRQGALGITPDLTTLGKYFGGGLSFGAFGGRGDVMERFDPRRPDALAHAGTFNNNVLSMAAGYAGLARVLTADAISGLNLRGELLRERLNGLFARRGVALHCSGMGSLMNLHAVAGPVRTRADLQGEDARAKTLLFFELLERGVYIAHRGLMALSLPWGDSEVDELVSAVDAAVARHEAVLPARE